MLLYTAIDYSDSNEYQEKAFLSLLSYLLCSTKIQKAKIYTNKFNWWAENVKKCRISDYMVDIVDVEKEIYLQNLNAKQIKIQSMIDSIVLNDSSNISIFVDAESLCIRPFQDKIQNFIIDGGYLIGLSQECGSTGITEYTNMNSGLIFINKNRQTLSLLEAWLRQYTHNISVAKMAKNQSVHQPDQLALRQTLRLLHPKIYNVPQECNARFHPVFDNNQQLWCPLYCIHNHKVMEELLVRVKTPFFSIKKLFKLIQTIDIIANVNFEDWKPRTISIDYIIDNI